MANLLQNILALGKSHGQKSWRGLSFIGVQRVDTLSTHAKAMKIFSSLGEWQDQRPKERALKEPFGKLESEPNVPGGKRR